MVSTRRNTSAAKDIIDEDNSHDSMTEMDEDEITLNMLLSQMKKMELELSSKIDIAKSDIVNQLQLENSLLKDELRTVKEDLDKQSKEMSTLREEMEDIKYDKVNYPEFDELERDIAEVQQYIRRNNIEICNIPEDVKDLEQSVIKIGRAADITILRSDIEACHRLHKKANNQSPRNVIVRFVNRKKCESLLRKSKSFANPSTQEKAGLKSRIYINNNLCGYYKMLWGKTKKLYNKNLVDEFWIFNGTLNVVKKDNPPERITHLNDLIDLFPEHEKIIVAGN